MLIININGPINSGKTTVSKLLSKQLPISFFIEVDDLLSDGEQKLLGLSVKAGWQERTKRLKKIIEEEKQKKQYKSIVFAYPMTDKLFNEWKRWEDKTTEFVNITWRRVWKYAYKIAENVRYLSLKSTESEKCIRKDTTIQNLPI